MNEARLRKVLRAFDVWRECDDYQPEGKSRVRWATTADGWELRPDDANWKFAATTMDGCVELFALKLREIAVEAVLATRKRLDASVQALAIVDEMLGVTP